MLFINFILLRMCRVTQRSHRTITRGVTHYKLKAIEHNVTSKDKKNIKPHISSTCISAAYCFDLPLLLWIHLFPFFFAVNFFLWWDFPHFSWSVWITTFYLPTPRMTRTKWQFLKLSHRLASVFKSKCSNPGSACSEQNSWHIWEVLKVFFILFSYAWYFITIFWWHQCIIQYFQIGVKLRAWLHLSLYTYICFEVWNFTRVLS